MLIDEKRSQLLDGYRTLEGTFDELVDASGKPRPLARTVSNMLAGLSPEEFARCQALADLALSSRG